MKKLLIVGLLSIILVGCSQDQAKQKGEEVASLQQKPEQSERNQPTLKTSPQEPTVPEINQKKQFSCIKEGLYTSESFKISFQCPKGWYIEEDASTSRIYISNMQGDFHKGNIPSDFQKVWISTWEQEATRQREESTKKGMPDCCDIKDTAGNFTGEKGQVLDDSIKNGDLTIRTYEFRSGGGPVIQAFWEDDLDRMYFATNASEVGPEKQKKMIKSLRDILATVELVN